MGDSEKQTRALKQDYLKENVIEQGYDGNSFADFMASKKQNGTDIENWRYEELIAMVQEFTASFHEDSQIYYEDEQIPQDPNQENMLASEVNFDSKNEQVIPAIRITTEVGGNKNTKIKIIKLEKEKTGSDLHPYRPQNVTFY